jgi:hypothetical protein
MMKASRSSRPKGTEAGDSRRDRGGIMTSHSEFRWSYSVYCMRHTARVLTIFGSGAVVFFLLWLILGLAEPQQDPTERSEIAMTIAILVSLALVGLWMRYAERDARLDSTLICPECESPLGYLYGITVLSSGNCPHCGTQVIEG